MVLEIGVRNGIMLVNHFWHLERYGGETWGFELVVRGARGRVTPTLMTARSSGPGLVPLAIAGGPSRIGEVGRDSSPTAALN